jgi:hypothetical protein
LVLEKCECFGFILGNTLAVNIEDSQIALRIEKPELLGTREESDGFAEVRFDQPRHSLSVNVTQKIHRAGIIKGGRGCQKFHGPPRILWNPLSEEMAFGQGIHPGRIALFGGLGKPNRRLREIRRLHTAPAGQHLPRIDHRFSLTAVACGNKPFQ